MQRNMPKAPRYTPDSAAAVAYTPTRADASVITAGMSADTRGLGNLTNNRTGKLQQKATTGKTITTGGTL